MILPVSCLVTVYEETFGVEWKITYFQMCGDIWETKKLVRPRYCWYLGQGVSEMGCKFVPNLKYIPYATLQLHPNPHIPEEEA